MAYIFLSHSHSDKPFARKIAADMRAYGHSVWIDEAEINIGDSLINKIREGLDRVDYVCAILSKNSIDSAWVQKELEIASDREIEEKRVVVLPLILDNVKLPGFLKGKFYGDFTDEAKYDESFKKLLRSIGGGKKMDGDRHKIEELQAALKFAQSQAEVQERAANRAAQIAFRAKSQSLQKEISRANAKYPNHAPINNTYAFEVGSMAVTLDYLLWAIEKAGYRGGHPLDMLISLNNKWPEAEAMLEAYRDVLDRQ
ncbi:MAG TPA: toll/interleukin-1 receptor domain-containing protein [Rhizomicrobium sp.]|jgi:hypothetical protein